jgi:hypothetical protein
VARLHPLAPGPQLARLLPHSRVGWNSESGYSDTTFLSQPAIPVVSLIKRSGEPVGTLLSFDPSLTRPPCPFCDSEEIEVFGRDGVNGAITLRRCKTCLKEWSETIPADLKE